MTISLIEMLELQDFGHMNKPTIQFESRDKILVDDVMDRSYDAITFISRYLHFKKAWGSQFC